VQLPVKDRLFLALDARDAVVQTQLADSWSGIGIAVDQLRPLIDAADRVEVGNRGPADDLSPKARQIISGLSMPWRLPVSTWVLDYLSWAPGIEGQKNLLYRIGQAEPAVNATLQSLLTNAVWHGGAMPPTGLVQPLTGRQTTCQIND